MFCFKCGKQIADDSRFCNFCGADQTPPAEPVIIPIAESVKAFCFRCGKQIEADSRFCNFCGADQTPPAEPVITPVAEPAKSFCFKCGNRIDAVSRFCDFCGADQTPPVAPVAEPVVQEEPEPVAEPVVQEEPEPVAEPVVQEILSLSAPSLEPDATEPFIETEEKYETAFCIRCGNQIADGSRFCVSCGADQHPTAQQPPEQFSEQPVFASKKNREKKKKLLIPAFLAVIVVLIALVANRGGDNYDELSPPPFETAPGGIAVNTTGNSASVNSSSSIQNTTAPAPVMNDPDTLPVLSSVPVDITRTVFVYIVGSNLESESGAASYDIKEMVDANFDSSSTQVIICTGGAKTWQNTSISADETAYFRIADHTITKVYSQASKNMADSATLSDFLNWGVQKYPSDRYSLILWNHGSGPLIGYGNDEKTSDSFSLEELVKSLYDSPFSADNKLEVIGFDACLMGTVETAWAFSNYADYFVASQEIEPGNGWNYEFLEKLAYCEDGDDVGRVIIDAYFERMELIFMYNPSVKSEITLSCIDLSAIEDVEKEIDTLFSVVNEDVLVGQIAQVSRCRYNSKSFGKIGSSFDYDLVDLTHIASLLQPFYSQATALQTALDTAIVYSKANVPNAYGLSIYHPYDNIELAEVFGMVYKTFGFAEKYTEYIHNFVEKMLSGSQSSYRNFSKVAGSLLSDDQQSDIAIQLTAEQMQTFSSASYLVYWEIPADQSFHEETDYLHIFSGQDVNVSADGKLTATYDGKAVFGKDNKTGEYSDCPLSMYQIYDGTQEEKYYFPTLFVKWYGTDMEMDSGRWMMEIVDGKPVLRTVYRTEHLLDEQVPDRITIDPEKYDYFIIANKAYQVNTDSNNNTVLEMTDSTYGFEYQLENGFSLELLPIEDKSQYRAVFLIEDIYGNSYYSAFIPLG